MAIAVRRTYACPTCRESFTKWGLCQGHVRTSAPCREALSEELRDPDALQCLCREAASAGVVGSAADALAPGLHSCSMGFPNMLSGKDPVAASSIPAPGKAHMLSNQYQQLGSLSDERSPKRVAVAAVKRFDRAVQTGHLSEAERHELDGRLEDLAEHPFVIQNAAVDKFFAPGLAELRWIADKHGWLLRCLRFCVRTNLAGLPERTASPSTVLISALASQSLLPDALSQECWDTYAALPTELQNRVVGAVRSSILINVVGNLPDHFRNLVRNEQVVYDLEGRPTAQAQAHPQQVDMEAIDGSLYHLLLQDMLFRKRNSEERLLRELAEADASIEPGGPGSVLYLHASTADARREGSADVLSVLHAAASSGLVRICARFIAEGLDVQERAGCQESTPLHLAAVHGEVEVVRLLVSKRADPNIRDTDGHSALYAAVTAAVHVRKRGEQALTFHSLQMKVCSLLLLAGAQDVPDQGSTDCAEPLSAEALAEAHNLFDLQNLIRLHTRLRCLRQKFPIDDAAIAELCGLQYETAMFVILVFESHLAVSHEAAPTEFRALIASEFVQSRDHVQRLGNRLARRLLLSKKAVDALTSLPPQAGILALSTWKIEEIIPRGYDVPDHLNVAAPLLLCNADCAEDASIGNSKMSPGGELSSPGASHRPDKWEEPKLQGRIRKWDSDRGFGFIVQDPTDGEELGRDVFVHRKNIIGSTPARHLDLRENSRISFRLGEQDGRPRALDATMLGSDGQVHPMHLSKPDDASANDAASRDEVADGNEDEGDDGDLSRKFLRHLRSREIQELAKEKRTKIESWLRCVGLRRHNTGRRDDVIWKKEIERRVDIFLERNSTPLQKKDFDFRVRRFLHEFSFHNTVTRVSEALAAVEASTVGKNRDDVRSWPAYLATLLKNFDPKLHEILADRDRRSRIDVRRARPEAAIKCEGDGQDFEGAMSEDHPLPDTAFRGRKVAAPGHAGANSQGVEGLSDDLCSASAAGSCSVASTRSSSPGLSLGGHTTPPMEASLGRQVQQVAAPTTAGNTPGLFPRAPAIGAPPANARLASSAPIPQHRTFQ